MKTLARSYVWWPGINQDIETKSKARHACISVSNTPAIAPLQPWSWPDKPWQRVHMDYADHRGQHFFVLVDTHAKWPEVFPKQNTTTEEAIDIPRGLFASYGFPKEMVAIMALNSPQIVRRFPQAERDKAYQVVALLSCY